MNEGDESRGSLGGKMTNGARKGTVRHLEETHSPGSRGGEVENRERQTEGESFYCQLGAAGFSPSARLHVVAFVSSAIVNSNIFKFCPAKLNQNRHVSVWLCHVLPKEDSIPELT